MIKRLNSVRGQTALVLILLTAAALIFLSITLNWGRIAQTKTLLTIAADQAASLLASDAASYGEMEKQTNLQDTNQVSALSGVLMDIIMIDVAIIILIIAIFTVGAGAGLYGIVIAALIVVMAIVTLTLELTVIQPGMEALWNKLQQDQPVQQQFFEGGISQALQGSVTDQVNITDYFDSNTNGLFGISGSTPNDTVSRFAFFYTDRLKMLNKGVIPQVAFFYDQLMEFINGETCYQNYIDSGSPTGTVSSTGPWVPSNTGVPVNPVCVDPTTGEDYCYSDPKDPACTQPISNLETCAQNAYENSVDSSIPLNPECPGSPNNPDTNSCSGLSPTDPACQLEVSNPFSFQLNDSCTDSVPGSPTYNPYCDPCCQPWAVSTSGAKASKQTYKILRPSTCGSTGTPPSDCIEGSTTFNSQDSACEPPSGECSTNNPYPSSAAGPLYPYLYDASYQEYANGVSFLDQYGRDEQFPDQPTSAYPFENTLDPEGSAANGAYFPNGIYPFFWLMRDYSPEVDTINPTTIDSTAQSSQGLIHWCAAGTTDEKGKGFPTFTAPTGFTDLAQLTFPAGYTCSGQDCCVNYLPDSFTASPNSQTSNVLQITLGNAPTISLTNPTSGNSFQVGSSTNGTINIAGSASEANPGIASVAFQITFPPPGGTTGATPSNWIIGTLPASSVNFSGQIILPTCTEEGGTLPSGPYSLTAIATDENNPPNTTSDPVAISITNPYACGSDTCGTNICGAACGAGCATGYTCQPDSSIPNNPSTGPGTCVCSTSCPGYNCGTSCGTSCGNCSGTCTPADGIAGDPGTCSS